MMDDESIALAREVAAHPSWRWLDGSVWFDPRLEVRGMVRGWSPVDGCVPDLDDGLTLGAMVIITRRAWRGKAPPSHLLPTGEELITATGAACRKLARALLEAP